MANCVFLLNDSDNASYILLNDNTSVLLMNDDSCGSEPSVELPETPTLQYGGVGFASYYADMQRRKRQEAIQQRIDLLERKIRRVMDEIKQYEDSVSSYRGIHNRLRDLKVQLSGYREERDMLAARYWEEE